MNIEVSFDETEINYIKVHIDNIVKRLKNTINSINRKCEMVLYSSFRLGQTSFIWPILLKYNANPLWRNLQGQTFLFEIININRIDLGRQFIQEVRESLPHQNDWLPLLMTPDNKGKLIIDLLIEKYFDRQPSDLLMLFEDIFKEISDDDLHQFRDHNNRTFATIVKGLKERYETNTNSGFSNVSIEEFNTVISRCQRLDAYYRAHHSISRGVPHSEEKLNIVRHSAN